MSIGDELQLADGQRGRETELVKGNRTLLPTLIILSCIAEVSPCHFKNVNNVFRQKVMLWFTCGFFFYYNKKKYNIFFWLDACATQLPSQCSWPEVIFSLVLPRKCSMRNCPSSLCQVLLLELVVATALCSSWPQAILLFKLGKIFLL